MIYLGLDDTDMPDSRGTGRLARSIAGVLSKHFNIFGVTRHQLFVHPDIPYTSHNSCAVIHVDASDSAMNEVYDIAKKMVLGDFIKGSDPGLAIAAQNQVTPALVALGLDTKRTIVTQSRAKEVALNSQMRFESLGGTGDGIIGAIAGIGLASLKNDGRFLLKDKNRELAAGARFVSEIINSGIDEVLTLHGVAVKDVQVEILKNATPSFVQGKAVLFVEERDGRMIALKRD